MIHQADNMDQLQQSLELLANRRIHGKLVLVNPVPVETEPFSSKDPMKAYQIRDEWSLENLQLVDLPEPVPGPGKSWWRSRLHR